LPVGPAQGEVLAAGSDELVLRWNYYVTQLTPLVQLRPDDLSGLWLPKLWPADPSTVQALGQLTGLRDLRFDSPHLSLRPEHVPYLQRLTALEVLYAGSMGLTDTLLTFLASLTSLQDLYLGENKHVLGPGLRHLSSLPVLRELDLERTGVDDDALISLAPLSTLESLSLLHTPVNGSGLRHLRPLQPLRSLDLSETALEDASLMHMAALPHLEQLVLAWTPVGNEGVRQLAACESLRELVLDYTKVTDAGIRALHGLSRLRLLSLAGTAVSVRGAYLLREALPGCTVEL